MPPSDELRCPNQPVIDGKYVNEHPPAMEQVGARNYCHWCSSEMIRFLERVRAGVLAAKEKGEAA